MPNELADLSEVIAICQERRSRFDDSLSVNIDEQLWTDIKSAYLAVATTDTVTIVGGHTFWITTPDNKFLAISAQEIPRCWAAIPYVAPIMKYEEIVNELASYLGYTARSSARAKSEVFDKLPSREWRNNSDPNKKISPTIITQIDSFLSSRFPNDPVSLDRFTKLLENPDWSGVSKQLARADWIEAAIQAVGGWLAVGAARRGLLVQALAQVPSIDQKLATALAQSNLSSSNLLVDHARVEGGENIIFYGAPGTGKSHKVDTYEGSEQQFTVRTVFHADTQNSDFIGALKPGLVEERITYAFAPGPFAQALAMAHGNPDRRVTLIIEELNRAPAAAVFGELFLLLDRSSNGEGRYDANFASPEFEKWFFEETGLKQKKVRLPSNLWLLATMNSSDQGVFPLDAAFRRRWQQEYLPINYDDAPRGNVNVVSDEGHFSVSWQMLLKILNEFLLEEFRVVEDRLLGQRFLSEADLENRSRLPQKVLLYLFDDLLRHEVNRDKLFLKHIRTIGDLITNSETDSAIFSSSFIERLPRQDGEKGNLSVGDE